METDLLIKDQVAEIFNMSFEQIDYHVSQGNLKTIDIGLKGRPDIRFTYRNLKEFIRLLERQSDILSAEPTTIHFAKDSVGHLFEINLLRINLKSSGINPGTFCINNGAVGVGHRIKKSGIEITDWATYEELAKKENIKLDSASLLKRIPTGSIVWTRQGYRNETNFFLGLITGEWKYIDTPEAREADIHNVRDCIWVKIGDYSQIIDEIRRAFTPTTLEYIRNKTAIVFTKKIVADFINKGIFPDLVGLTAKSNPQ